MSNRALTPEVVDDGEGRRATPVDNRGFKGIYTPNGDLFKGEEQLRGLTVEDVIRRWSETSEMYGVDSGSKAFKNLNHIYSAVDRIATTTAMIPPNFINVQTNKIDNESDVAKLFGRPSKRQSWYSLMYTSVCHLETDGNALWYLDFGASGPRPGELPERMLPLIPSQIKIVRPKDIQDPQQVVAYRYTIPHTGQTILLEPITVFHTQYPDPSNPFWGQASTRALTQTMRTDSKSQDYGEVFFDNSATMTGALIHEDILPSDKIADIRQQFKDRHRGVARAHSTLIMSGAWTYKQFGSTMVDADYIRMRELTMRDIYAGLNVPNLLMNREDKVPLATARVILRMFRDTKTKPLIRQFEQDLQVQFFDPYAPTHRIEYDMTQAVGTAESAEEMADALDKLVKSNVSLNKAIAFLRLPIEPEPWGDEAFRSIADTTAQAIVDTAGEEPEPDDDDDDDDDSKTKTVLRQVSAKKQKALSDYLLIVNRRIDLLVAAFNKKLVRYIRKLRVEVFKNLFALPPQSYIPLYGDRRAMERRNILDDYINQIVFDMNEANAELKRISRADLTRALVTGGDMVNSELAATGSYTISTAFGLSALVNRQNKIVGINNTIFEDLREVLRESLENGEGTNELANNLRTKVFEPSAQRARVIARTEVQTMLNAGRVDAMKQNGVTRHQWLSAGDELVREEPYNHAIDGQAVTIGDLFSTQLRWPLDPDSPGSQPENLVNCRCLTLAVV